LGVALPGDGAEQLGAQTEGFERRSNGFLLHSAWKGLALRPVQADAFWLVIERSGMERLND
jgi:hypothetical protein